MSETFLKPPSICKYMYTFPVLYCMHFLVFHRIFSLFRFHQIKQQYDLKVHEAELVQARLKQSTHHHQLEEVEALQKTVGKSSVVFICNSCHCYNAFETQRKLSNPSFSNLSIIGSEFFLSCQTCPVSFFYV